MKSVKTLLILAALTASSVAMAEGGSDRVIARMEAARQNSMQAYQVAQTQGTQPPVAESKTKEMDHKNC
jgi:hypothetical protein